jgi:hypothetical protein
MDVSMAFMGGMEATELIRLYEMHRGLPPLRLTLGCSSVTSLSPGDKFWYSDRRLAWYRIMICKSLAALTIKFY